MLLSALLLATVATATAASTFRVKPEFPASEADPNTHTYATLLFDEAGGALPAGAKFLRLVVDSPGPLGAVAAPLEWAEVGTSSRMMIAMSNFSNQWSNAPSHFPAIKGSVTVHAEAWTERVPGGINDLPMEADAGTDPAGKVLGRSASLELFFDFSFGSIQFLTPVVTDIGPGEASIEFPPHPQDAARLEAEGEMFFFCRCGPVANKTKGAPKDAINRTKGGKPIFSWCANQYQHAYNSFTFAWTQPGIYYVGMSGAWNGNTFHTVMLEPQNGIETTLYPFIPDPDPAGQFQPMALIVPYENGTKPALPAGFAGPSHVLPPIVGDKRVALTKKNLTFFHGSHFYLPLSSPAPSGGSLFPGEHWPTTVAVDVDLPIGCEMVNGTDNNVSALPGAAAGRHRVRFTSTNHAGNGGREFGKGFTGKVGIGVLFSDRSIEGTTHTVGFRSHTASGLTAEADTWLGWQLGLGVLFSNRSIEGSTHTVGFRAHTAAGLATETSTNKKTEHQGTPTGAEAGWVESSVAMVARPNFNLPKFLSTGLNYGVDLASWPVADNGAVTPLTTYKALGLNTVPSFGYGSCKDENCANGGGYRGVSIFLPEDRKTPEWEGMKYGPQLASPWSGLVGHMKATVAFVESVNISSACNKTLSAAEEVVEREKWHQAAEFHQTVVSDCNFGEGKCSDVIDVGYNGCLLERSLNFTAGVLNASQPELAIFDIEGMVHWELWITNAGRSKNALSQRQGKESLAALGRRMSKNLLHSFTDKMKAVAPNSALAMWESEAQDDKGCCSGSNKGTINWQMIEEVGGWSYPGLYNGDKNLKLLAARLSREKQALKPGWMMLPTFIPLGAQSFSGGNQRTEYDFDVMIQAFANGATGLSVFEDYYTDDPGVYLAYGKAISLVVPYEDVIINGTISAGAITMLPGSARAIGSAMHNARGFFIVVTPRLVWTHAGSDTPPPETVSFKFDPSWTEGPGYADAGGGGTVQLLDLLTNETTACIGHCTIEKKTSSSLVYFAALGV